MKINNPMLKCAGGSRSCDHTKECFKAQDKALKVATKRSFVKTKIRSTKEGQRIIRNLKRRKTFECPWCEETRPKTEQCSKGYCVSCAGNDCY